MKKKVLISIIIMMFQYIMPMKLMAFSENVETTSAPATIEYKMASGGALDVGKNAFFDEVSTTIGLFLEPTIYVGRFMADIPMYFISILLQQSELLDPITVENYADVDYNSKEAATTYVMDADEMDSYRTAVGFGWLVYPNIKISPEEILNGEIEILNVNFITGKNYDGTEVKSKSWNALRDVISQWYKALRMLVIVGLLAMLIFTGIKIILASTSSDKAKYKKLIGNWFIAVILAFSLHYVMALVMAVTGEIMQMFPDMSGIIEVRFGPYVKFNTNLIGLARFQMQQHDIRLKISYLIIYIALMVYIFKFIFIYLKRLVKMAFLTIISPIIALMYPIDKMDGSARTLDMWLKEYIYSALLPIVHYLLYYVLISSSLALAASNPVYAIVALWYITQAEKLLKKVFGFEKARGGVVSGLAGSFAAGALASKFVKKHSNSKGGKKTANRSNDDMDLYLSDDYYHQDYLEDFLAEGKDYGHRPENIRNGEADTASTPREQLLREMIKLYNLQPSGCTPDEFIAILQTSGYSDDEIADFMDVFGDNISSGDIISSEDIISSGNIISSRGTPTGQSIEQRPTPIRRMSSGIKAVSKHLAKPIWDFDRSGKYNAGKLTRNIGGTVLGLGIGATTAAIQAGISITDGKYNPLEGVASIGAGVIGTKAVINKIGQNGGVVDTYKKAANAGDDEKLMKDYSKRWYDRQDVIDNFEKQFPGKGKAMRKRAAKNYVTRGITNFQEQKEAIKFAELIKDERGIAEEEADKIAVATVQYKRSLLYEGNYAALFDKKRREQYLKTVVDGYTGNADKDVVRNLHLDFMQNVLDLDRANR